MPTVILSASRTEMERFVELHTEIDEMAQFILLHHSYIKVLQQHFSSFQALRMASDPQYVGKRLFVPKMEARHATDYWHHYRKLLSICKDDRYWKYVRGGILERIAFTIVSTKHANADDKLNGAFVSIDGKPYVCGHKRTVDIATWSRAESAGWFLECKSHPQWFVDPDVLPYLRDLRGALNQSVVGGVTLHSRQALEMFVPVGTLPGLRFWCSEELFTIA